MDLFDKVSKTVSDTGQKAKDLADIAGINNKISGNKRQIKKLFEQLGEAYYNEHSENPESTFEDFIDDIDDLQEQIDVWDDQIQQLKGYVKCPECGEFVEKDETECPNCGHSFLPEGTVVCPNCGAVITEPDEIYCQFCGAQLDRQPVAQPCVTKECKPIKCTCGAILEKDEMFCPNCGNSRKELERLQDTNIV